MGDPVDEDGEDAGVAEDDLVVTACGRIALEGGADVGGEGGAQFRQAFQELQGRFLSLFVTLITGVTKTAAFVTQAAADLA